MDTRTFSQSLESESVFLIVSMYNFDDLPRTRVHEFLTLFQNFLQSTSITTFLNQLIARLSTLKEHADNLAAYRTMTNHLQNAFKGFESEHKFIAYLTERGSYISPKQIKVGIEPISSASDGTSVVLGNRKITAQFFPLRRILKHFFELPGMFDQTMSFMKTVEGNKILMTNIMNGSDWKSRKVPFGDKIVLPILLYGDDFETNNPIGSHKGLGKIGGVYIVISCLPPHLQSKTANIVVQIERREIRFSQQIFRTMCGRIDFSGNSWYNRCHENRPGSDVFRINWGYWR